ncbi:glycoside hydrolase family 28 protein [Dichotomopilus funicola]|uniref:Glycoside hydrolase family 28 protein n=1 Tax=Dichotomopilus funicola TaxID=1934379 RepID=A0AAN6UUG4_9PEZI|nr:glycoside hydrolase family 28 protein [Dichotomopilus funicola]
MRFLRYVLQFYSKVYSVNCNQMMMIKSNGGSGTAENVKFDNFIGHNNAYSLNIDQAWASMTPASGSGIHLKDITVSNWKGDCANRVQRGLIQFKCAAGAPCTGMTVKDFSVWTNAGSQVNYVCNNTYGTGSCLRVGSGGTYSTTSKITTAPAGWQAPRLPTDLKSSFGFTSEIPIPAIPLSFFPGTSPSRRLA